MKKLKYKLPYFHFICNRTKLIDVEKLIQEKFNIPTTAEIDGEIIVEIYIKTNEKYSKNIQKCS
jgi:hypothetical protein